MLQLSASSVGDRELSMHLANPDNTGRFAIYDETGEGAALVDISANVMDGPLVRLTSPSQDDTVSMTSSGLQYHSAGQLMFDLNLDGLGFRLCDNKSGGRGTMKSIYGACGLVVADGDFEDTMIVVDERGVFVARAMKDRTDWDAYLTPDSFKFAPGAADGYVLTADAFGRGTWQPGLSGGGGWTDDGDVVRLDTESDNVGIGTDTPSGKLHVYSNDGDEAIYSMSTGGDGTSAAGYFQGGGMGVIGYVPGGGGYRYGVMGHVGGDDTTYSIGVYGITNTGDVSMGVYGHGTNGVSGTYGVAGTADGTGYHHKGVQGTASDGDSTNIGVEGRAVGTGLMSNYGFLSNAWGASSLNCGIYATASGGAINYAGWFEGDVHITGTLTGGGVGGGWTDDGDVVRLTTSGDRVGIGVANPSENLVVGVDLGSGTGNRIVVGDTSNDSQTGLVFGEGTDDRGFVFWDVAQDVARLGTRHGGTLYASTLTWNHDKVGINTSSPTEELHVNGDICYTGSIGACSDARYKKDIETIDNASEILMKLRGIKYNWRQDDYPDIKFDDATHLGFVAQEVRELLPEVVIEDDNGYLSVDYSRLTPVLVEALKDMRREKDVQDEKVNRLEHELRQLKAMMEEMRSQTAH